MNTQNSEKVRSRCYEAYRPQSEPDDYELRRPYLRSFIRRYLPRNRDSRIVDLGCGKGALLRALANAGYLNLLGVDGSPSQVAEATRRCETRVIQTQLLDFLRTAPTAGFDVVISFDLIEHLTKDELLDVADQINRILSTDGRWVIHAPNASGLFGSRIRYADWTHEQAFTTETLRQIARLTGFRDAAVYEDAPVPHGFISLARLLVYRAVTLLFRFYSASETGTLHGHILSQNLIAILKR